MNRDDLKRVLEFLRGRWTKGAFARDAQGLGTLVYSTSAVQFCFIGGCIKVGANMEALEVACVKRYNVGLVHLNDGCETFEELEEKVEVLL